MNSVQNIQIRSTIRTSSTDKVLAESPDDHVHRRMAMLSSMRVMMAKTENKQDANMIKLKGPVLTGVGRNMELIPSHATHFNTISTIHTRSRPSPRCSSSR